MVCQTSMYLYLYEILRSQVILITKPREICHVDYYEVHVYTFFCINFEATWHDFTCIYRLNVLEHVSTFFLCCCVCTCKIQQGHNCNCSSLLDAAAKFSGRELSWVVCSTLFWMILILAYLNLIVSFCAKKNNKLPFLATRMMMFCTKTLLVLKPKISDCSRLSW